MALLLGIDNGSTVTKAVLFDEAGRVVALARRRVPTLMPRPRHVERDMGALWSATAEAVAEVIAQSGRPAGEIAAVATTAHGDGLYLLDRQARPLGPGILSLDSRAGDVAAAWEEDGTARRALERTGQMPHASAPSVILAWIRDNDPDRFARIGHVIACKDWLRLCLTGGIGTDLTEASTAFTDVRTQVYADDILPIFGLGALADALPQVALPDEVVGHVTPDAARLTGLLPGTPVVAAADVTASALGIGGYGRGVVAIVAGTYSINETVSDAPSVDRRWFCRNGLARGEWNNMSISPASTANYDWFLDQLCAADRARAEAEGGSIHDMLEPELQTALARLRAVPVLSLRLPPRGHASAGFSACMAGTGGATCCARWSRDRLQSPCPCRCAAGWLRTDRGTADRGISRNPTVAQVFADALGLPVTVTATEEAAAWGAALCAGSGVGILPLRVTIRVTWRRFRPSTGPIRGAAPIWRGPMRCIAIWRRRLRPSGPGSRRWQRGQGGSAMAEGTDDIGDIDVLILGAGINGAGLFRDLCEQGLRCVLLDKDDFGSGTSAAPSRLIHGGSSIWRPANSALSRNRRWNGTAVAQRRIWSRPCRR
ncbi:MAG: FAD-dependent oxidoreductase [Defluviimonas denitrificans]